MELTIIYVTTALLLGLFAKNNNFVNFFLIVALYLLFAFEHSDQDYLNYVSSYNSVGTSAVFELLGYEPSFFLFCIIGNNLSLSFGTARAFVCVLEVLAIVTSVKIFTPQIACVISLFLIFPATADAELFRWLAGMCLVIYAFPYLIRKESKWDYVLYSVLVIFATLIHTSCIFFLFYNLMCFGSKKRIFVIVITTFVVLSATAQTNLLYKVLAVLPVQDSLNDKFQQTNHSNIFGQLSIVIRELFVFIMGYIASVKYRKLNTSITFLDNKASVNRAKYSQRQMGVLLCERLWHINIISVLLIAIAIYTPQVQRLFHVLLFLNSIAIVFVSKHLKNKSLIFVAIICVMMTLILHINSGPQNLEIFMSHFNEGFLINCIDVLFHGAEL